MCTTYVYVNVEHMELLHNGFLKTSSWIWFCSQNLCFFIILNTFINYAITKLLQAVAIIHHIFNARDIIIMLNHVKIRTKLSWEKNQDKNFYS